LEFVQRNQICLSVKYIILDNTELHFLCFENRCQAEAMAGVVEVLTTYYYRGAYEYPESDDADVHAIHAEQSPCRRTTTCSGERQTWGIFEGTPSSVLSCC
jgi:hypothetical protein